MTFRYILVALAILFAIRFLGRLLGAVAQGAREGARSATGGRGAPVKMMQDPVCGTFVVPGKALSLSAGGTTHWFCSERCRAEYSKRA